MYIVMEIQKNNDQISTLVNTYDNINQAKNKYYTILAHAAVSQIDKHSASILNEKGLSLFNEGFVHKEEEEE